jgi:hypothetical protein
MVEGINRIFGFMTDRKPQAVLILVAVCFVLVPVQYTVKLCKICGYFKTKFVHFLRESSTFNVVDDSRRNLLPAPSSLIFIDEGYEAST